MRFGQVGNRLVVLILVLPPGRAHQVRIGQLGLDPDKLVEPGNRRVILTLSALGSRTAEIRGENHRIMADHFVVIGDRAIIFFLIRADGCAE